MPNLLTPLNITDVNQITQEQINGVMNTHLIIPELIIFTIILFIFLSLLGLTLKGAKSKIKYYSYLGWGLLFSAGLIILFYFFVNSISQVLNSILNF